MLRYSSSDPVCERQGRGAVVGEAVAVAIGPAHAHRREPGAVHPTRSVSAPASPLRRRLCGRHLPRLADYARRYVHRAVRVDNPVLIVNRWSGGGKAESLVLADAAERVGIETVMLERGLDLVSLAKDAVKRGADAIGMAGGDGSLSLVASVAIGHDIPFFCVPVGTRNHFALDLGLDRDDPLAALDAVSDGREISIDHGLVGGRVFLNNVCLGVYPMAVKKENYRDKKAESLIDTLVEAAGSTEQ